MQGGGGGFSYILVRFFGLCGRLGDGLFNDRLRKLAAHCHEHRYRTPETGKNIACESAPHAAAVESFQTCHPSADVGLRIIRTGGAYPEDAVSLRQSAL